MWLPELFCFFCQIDYWLRSDASSFPSVMISLGVGVIYVEKLFLHTCVYFDGRQYLLIVMASEERRPAC